MKRLAAEAREMMRSQMYLGVRWDQSDHKTCMSGVSLWGMGTRELTPWLVMT